MEINEMTVEAAPKRPSRGRQWLIVTALASGVALGAAGIAGAASDTSASTATTTAAVTSGAAATTDAATKDPATPSNGPGETLLTGDTAAKVTAAAKAAQPDASVIRVETDSGDAEYEAHMKKADGTMVTVLLDKDFKVTSTEQGFGAGGHGGGRHGSGSDSDADDSATNANA